jgi:1-deoxy-D-xylulose-5-phosphate synthase
LRILDSIFSHADLIGLDQEQRATLCGEIREFLVQSLSKTGGHLASNLGVVELTVALETVFDSNIDRLVFDVGHQSYVHKLLTGRQADFARLRQFGGIAGFPKPSESQRRFCGRTCLQLDLYCFRNGPGQNPFGT